MSIFFKLALQLYAAYAFFYNRSLKMNFPLSLFLNALTFVGSVSTFHLTQVHILFATEGGGKGEQDWGDFFNKTIILL